MLARQGFKQLQKPLSTSLIHKRNFMILPIYFDNTPSPKMPTPLNKNSSEQEREKFNEDYQRYYEYYEKSNKEKIFYGLVITGAVIGTGIGFREAINNPNKTGRAVLPLLYCWVGGIGGALPPFGLWGLYCYSQGDRLL